jgi:hypothetical protein
MIFLKQDRNYQIYIRQGGYGSITSENYVVLAGNGYHRGCLAQTTTFSSETLLRADANYGGNGEDYKNSSIHIFYDGIGGLDSDILGDIPNTAVGYTIPGIGTYDSTVNGSPLESSNCENGLRGAVYLKYLIRCNSRLHLSHKINQYL